MIHPIRWRRVVAAILGKAASRTSAVDVADRLWCIEGELIRTDTHHRAVPLMQSSDVEVSVSAKYRELRGNTRDGPEFWTRKPPQGRVAELIDDAIHKPEQKLGKNY